LDFEQLAPNLFESLIATIVELITMGKFFHYFVVDYATADATRHTMVPVAPLFPFSQLA
jgi:hypothetical protein